nr:hypothetical protein [Tanacetum cinerariifolium]
MLDTTIGCTVPLLPVAPDRAGNELKASVERLFDEGGSKSRSTLQRLLARAVLNVEVEIAAMPTLPFVTASVSTTPEREDKDHTNSIAEPNLRTIGAPSSAHIMTTATIVTSTVEYAWVAKEKPVRPSLFSVDSSLANGADPNTGVFSDLIGSDFIVGGKRRMKVVVEKQDKLLKDRDGEIKNLKAQLLLKETDAAEATRLHAQTSNPEAVEKSLRDEVNALKGRNIIHEKERNALDVKVTDLKASVMGKDRDLTDLNAQLTSVKSQNDSLAYQVHELKISSIGLLEKITMYDNCVEQLEKFQDERIKVVNDKLAKLDSDLVEMLKVPIHRYEDQVVLGETSLSSALSVSHSRVERIRENIAAQRLALAGVWTPLSEPLTVTSLMGEESTPSVVPAASVTTTALPTTFASTSSIRPISTNDYEIIGVYGQEGAGTDGRVVAYRNLAPFPNVDDVELNIPR